MKNYLKTKILFSFSIIYSFAWGSDSVSDLEKDLQKLSVHQHEDNVLGKRKDRDLETPNTEPLKKIQKLEAVNTLAVSKGVIDAAKGFFDLPPEIHATICNYLTRKDLKAIRQLCVYTNNLYGHAFFERNLYFNLTGIHSDAFKSVFSKAKHVLIDWSKFQTSANDLDDYEMSTIVSGGEFEGKFQCIKSLTYTVGLQYQYDSNVAFKVFCENFYSFLSASKNVEDLILDQNILSDQTSLLQKHVPFLRKHATISNILNDYALLLGKYATIPKFIESRQRLFNHINAMKKLQRLTLKNIFLMESLENLSALKTLTIEFANTSDGNRRNLNYNVVVNYFLKNLVNLECLTLIELGYDMSDKRISIDLHTLDQPHLKHLTAPEISVEEEEDMEKIRNIETLITKNFCYPDTLSPQAFSILTNLHTLNLYIEGDYVPDLRKCEKLEYLTLKYTERNEEENFPSFYLWDLINLKYLNIDVGSSPIDLSLNFLSSCDLLETLKLTWCNITLHDIDSIKHLSSLKKLCIYLTIPVEQGDLIGALNRETFINDMSQLEECDIKIEDF